MIGIVISTSFKSLIVTSHTSKHGSNQKDDIHNYEMEYTMEQSDIT